MEIDRMIEYKKWLNGLTIEKEIEYRNNGVNETIIEEIKKMDKENCNKNRNFTLHESTLDISYFSIQICKYNFREPITLKDLLDEIENEILFTIISEADAKSKQIIELKYQGYEVKEIALIMDMSIYQIYRKINKIKNKYYNAQK